MWERSGKRLHLAHEEDHDCHEQQHREPIDEDREQGDVVALRPHFDVDAVLEQT